MFDQMSPTARRRLFAKAVSSVVAISFSAAALEVIVFRGRGFVQTIFIFGFVGIAVGAYAILCIVRSFNHRDDPRPPKTPQDPPD